MRLRPCLLALGLLAALPAVAGVPSPRDVLGFTPGERGANHAEILRYCDVLADASPRVQSQVYGHTHEGRPLPLVIVSSEANLARLADIREATRRLADPRVKLDDSRLVALIATTPATAFMAYSIHGDEFSGADAALLMLHRLATSEEPAVRRLRDELVVLVDPLQNPDGRERILAMNAAFSGRLSNPDSGAMSHRGAWPWGRGNHYLFDLNRDWFALVHPETRGKAAILREWRPQLVVDAHEMGSGSTFLFNPPREPYNPLLPGSTLEWWNRFAQDHAAAFDRHGWSYYTREWNEEFFPGYGSSLPLYQGAVAILYEQASTNAQDIRKPHGVVFTHAEAVARQVESSFANLGTLVARRAEVMRSYRSARAEAIERGRTGPVRAFYFAPTPDAARAERLARTLVELGIEVEVLRDGGTLAAARDPWSDGSARVSLPPGTCRVRLDQPDGLVARVVLQPHVPMEDSFLAQEREYQERQKGGRLYDTTAWTPLLASGVDAWWSERLDRLGWEPWRAAPPAREAKVGMPAYAWAWDGTPDAALRLAQALVGRDFKVRVGREPVRLPGWSLPRGSFLVRVEENRHDGAAAVLAELATEHGVDVRPVASARVEEGPDLGGGRFSLLVPPRIGIVAGSPTDVTSVGAAWHALDVEFGVRASLLEAAQLGSADLPRYNVLVFPNAWGGGGAWKRALGDGGLAALRKWVQDGGTFVGLKGGAELAADESSQLSAVRARRTLVDEFPSPRLGLSAAAVAALERMQGMGLAADGGVVVPAGEWSKSAWPEELGIPGPGSPVLGPGTWAMLGEAGAKARRRGSLIAEESEDDERPAAGGNGADEKKKAARKADARVRRLMPRGAILRVDLDPEHWLAYGAGEKLAVMTRESDAMLARDPVRTVARYGSPESIHLGGLLWPEAAGRLAHTAWLTREGSGRGQVILFAGDPTFRGYFLGTQRCFLNAVLLGPGLGTRHVTPF